MSVKAGQAQLLLVVAGLVGELGVDMHWLIGWAVQLGDRVLVELVRRPALQDSPNWRLGSADRQGRAKRITPSGVPRQNGNLDVADAVVCDDEPDGTLFASHRLGTD